MKRLHNPHPPTNPPPAPWRTEGSLGGFLLSGPPPTPRTVSSSEQGSRLLRWHCRLDQGFGGFTLCLKDEDATEEGGGEPRDGHRWTEGRSTRFSFFSFFQTFFFHLSKKKPLCLKRYFRNICKMTYFVQWNAVKKNVFGVSSPDGPPSSAQGMPYFLSRHPTHTPWLRAFGSHPGGDGVDGGAGCLACRPPTCDWLESLRGTQRHVHLSLPPPTVAGSERRRYVFIKVFLDVCPRRTKDVSLTHDTWFFLEAASIT